MPIVLESNQSHAVSAETETCPTLPASMGLGGGYVPMIVATYNGNAYASANETGDISGTLKAKGGSLCGLGGVRP